MPRDFVACCATSCIKARLRSLLRTYEWSTCSKSSILFTETKSRQMKKERHQYPAILTEQDWSKKGLFILWTSYRGFDSQRFVLLLFSNLRVGKPPRPASYPDVSLDVRAKEGGKGLRLPSVPFPWSLAVYHQSLVSRSPLPCEKRSAWGGGCTKTLI